MLSKLLEFLNDINILYKYQFGFRKTHSTFLALEVAEKLYANLDVNNYGVGIYLDFQNKFDTVDHEILLYKLNHCGIGRNILEWFKSYPKNRKQFTSINGGHSYTSPINHGVQEGSVLVQYFFLIYVNHIQNAFHKDIKTLHSLANTELESHNTLLLANKH